MAIPSVNENHFFINEQVAFQEKIEACLWKLEALITIAVSLPAFYDLPDVTLQHYFSIASDLIGEATKTNEQSLNNLYLEQGSDIKVTKETDVAVFSKSIF
jgi:hypothetical protein